MYRNRPLFAYLSPLLALSLAACGGDSGSGGTVVVPPTSLAYDTANVTYETCEEVSNGANSDGSPLAFSIDPALPAGLVLNPTTGEIAGNPLAVTAIETYTITAANALGSVQSTVDLGVVDAPDPENLAYASANVTYQTNAPIVPNTVTFDGNLNSFAISPALPAGLTLSALTGAISGTPTADSPSTTYTVTGTNCENQTAQAPVTITIETTDGGPGPGSGDEPRFAYVSNGGDDTISILAFDGLTGRTRHFGFAPVGGTPTALAVSADQGELFVATTEGNVHIFAIDANHGGLTELTSSPVSTGVGASATELLLNAAGDALYVCNAGTNTVSFFSVAATGELTPIAGSPIALGGSNPASLAFAPGEDFLFVANRDSDNISVFQIAADNSIGSEQLFDTDEEPNALDTLTSASGAEILYVGTLAGQSLTGYSIDEAGTLTMISDTSSSLSVGSSLSFIDAVILPGTTQRVLFAGYASEGQVRRHFLAQNGEPGIPIGDADAWTGTSPNSLAIVPGRDFGLVTFFGDATVSSAELDITDAGDITVLEPTDRVRTRSFPTDVVIVTGAESGTFTTTNVYATNFSAADVSQYSFDPAGPGLTALTPASEAAGVNPESIVLHPRLAKAYVVDSVDPDSILVYDVAAGGTLTGPPVEIPIDGTGIVRDLAVDLSGRFLYAIRSDSTSELLSYPIDAAGDLGLATGTPLGSVARGVVVDPTGRYVYTANSLDGNLQGFEIDPITGMLSSIAGGPTATGSGPIALAVDPAGTSLYVANRGANSISQFGISGPDGVLSSLGLDVSLAMGMGPNALHVHRSGRLLFVAAESSSELIRIPINVEETNATTDGTLLPFPQSTPLDGTPFDIAGDASGSALFLTLVDDGDVITVSVDPAGELSAVPIVEQTAAAGGPTGSTRRLAIRDEL